MTKLELVLERIRKLPPERQDQLAIEIDFLIGDEETGSLFTAEEWSRIEPTLDDDDEEIPHEQVFAELRAKFSS